MSAGWAQPLTSAAPAAKKAKTSETEHRATDAEAVQFYRPLPLELRPRTHKKPPPLDTFVRSKLIAAQTKRADQTIASKVESKYLLLHNPKTEVDRLEQKAKAEEQRKRRQKMLSSREKKEKGVYDISGAPHDYNLYLPLHELWLEYIHDVAADGGDLDLGGRLLKADFHGAIIKVGASLCSSFIGVEGIILQETQNTFKVVTQQNRMKVIPKKDSVFTIRMADKLITIYGNHMLYRAADRASRKYKAKTTIDLFAK